VNSRWWRWDVNVMYCECEIWEIQEHDIWVEGHLIILQQWHRRVGGNEGRKEAGNVLHKLTINPWRNLGYSTHFEWMNDMTLFGNLGGEHISAFFTIKLSMGLTMLFCWRQVGPGWLPARIVAASLADQNAQMFYQKQANCGGSRAECGASGIGCIWQCWYGP
jgi:hypothetical protein